MKRLKTAIAFMLLATAHLLAVGGALAQEQERPRAMCSDVKFHILSEHTHSIVGYISAEVYVSGYEGDKLCIGGEFGGQEYQYMYKCNRYGHWAFQQKLKTFQAGCMWGKIT
jgi:hypothetical protein